MKLKGPEYEIHLGMYECGCAQKGIVLTGGNETCSWLHLWIFSFVKHNAFGEEERDENIQI